MSFSSGVFNINSTGQPVVTGTVISSTVFNAFTADIATGLSTCILKDGTQTLTGNIPMNSFKLTGLGSGTARTDAINTGQVQDGFPNYVSAVGGTADVITLTPSPAITAYTAGQEFSFIASGANTTNVTVAVSGLTAKAITKNGSTALVANDIGSGSVVTIRYDGARFQLIPTGNQAIDSLVVHLAGTESITGDKTLSGSTTLSGSVTVSGTLGMSGKPINEAQGSDVASNSTINLDTATGNIVDVTGTTTITAITLSQGRRRLVRFTGALTLTNGASLVLPGGANITTAAGDYAEFVGYASSVVRCSSYVKVNGSVITAPTSAQGSSLVLIGSTTSGGADADLRITSGLTSTYDDYIVDLVDIVNQNGAQYLKFQISTDSGSTWVTSGYDNASFFIQSSAATTLTVAGSVESFRISEATAGMAATTKLSATIRFTNPAAAQAHFFRSDRVVYNGNGVGVISGGGGATEATASAFNAIRIIMSTGNIQGGTMYLWALKKS